MRRALRGVRRESGKLAFRKKDDSPVFAATMSDVAFLLLVFVMLVSVINYKRAPSIEYAELPAESLASLEGERKLEIWVTKGGEIFLDGEKPVPLSFVETVISDLNKKDPRTRIYVIADRDTKYSRVDEVLGLLRALKWSAVSFVIQDAESEK